MKDKELRSELEALGIIGGYSGVFVKGNHALVDLPSTISSMKRDISKLLDYIMIAHQTLVIHDKYVERLEAIINYMGIDFEKIPEPTAKLKAVKKSK